MRGSMQGPSGPATRPYSLRGVVIGARVSDGPAVHWVYCPDRQMALVYDDNGVLVPTAGTHTKQHPDSEHRWPIRTGCGASSATAIDAATRRPRYTYLRDDRSTGERGNGVG